MKCILKISIVCVLSLILSSCGSKIKHPDPDKKLADKLYTTANLDSTSLDLSKLTDFDWDSVYIIPPYTDLNTLKRLDSNDVITLSKTAIETLDGIVVLAFMKSSKLMVYTEVGRQVDLADNELKLVSKADAVFKVIKRAGTVKLLLKSNNAIPVADIKVETTTFDLRVSLDYRYLLLMKDSSNKAYSVANYVVAETKTPQPFGKDRDLYLKEEIQYINEFLKAANKSVQLDLKTFTLPGTTQYIDVLSDLISFFNSSPEWTSFLNKKSTSENEEYELIRQLLTQSKVYDSFIKVIEGNGYKVEKIQIEKVMYLLPEDSQRYSAKIERKTPIPLHVWFDLTKL